MCICRISDDEVDCLAHGLDYNLVPQRFDDMNAVGNIEHRHVGRQNLKMVDALRAGALVVLELHDQARPRLHAGAEFERRPDRILDVERAPLMRHVDIGGRQLGALEILLGGREVILGIDAQADALADGRRRGLLEDEAVMASFLDAAQIERPAILAADRKAERVTIKGAAQAQILDGQDDMACPRDVERRRICGSGNGHR